MVKGKFIKQVFQFDFIQENSKYKNELLTLIGLFDGESEHDFHSSPERIDSSLFGKINLKLNLHSQGCHIMRGNNWLNIPSYFPLKLPSDFKVTDLKMCFKEQILQFTLSQENSQYYNNIYTIRGFFDGIVKHDFHDVSRYAYEYWSEGKLELNLETKYIDIWGLNR